MSHGTTVSPTGHRQAILPVSASLTCLPLTSERSQQLHVAIGSDAAYWPHVAAVVDSIVANTSHGIHLHLLANGISKTEQQATSDRLRTKQVDVTHYDTSDLSGHWAGGIARPDHLTLTMMDRLALPWLLPDVGRVLYLDVDTQVQADIADLIGTPCGERGIAASGAMLRGLHNMMLHFKNTPTEIEAVLMEFPECGGWKTFNSGVLVLDLDRLRANSFWQFCSRLARQYRLADQVVLNLYAGGQWVDFGREWNAHPAHPGNQRIAHWFGVVKPWHSPDGKWHRSFGLSLDRSLGRRHKQFVQLPPATCRPGLVDDTAFRRSATDSVKVLQRFGLNKDAKLLDVGCGYGRVAYGTLAVLRDIKLYMGVDASPEAIAWCKKQIATRNVRFAYLPTPGPNASEIAASPVRLPFHKAQFDMACACGLLERFSGSEARHYLAEIHRTLKTTGAVLLTSCVTDGSADTAKRPENGSAEVVEAGACTTVGMGTLEELVHSAGFFIAHREIDPSGRDTTFVLSKTSMLLRTGKVFVIGLNKTGTTTVRHALNQLGLPCKQGTDHFTRNRRGDLVLRRANEYKAFVDGDICVKYRELDAMFPGSKFVVTTRDVESWVLSRTKHLLRTITAGRYAPLDKAISVDGLDWRKQSIPQWVAERERHHGEVACYFKDRHHDCLFIDICHGEGWEKLCPFLGLPIPSTPFPKENVAD